MDFQSIVSVIAQFGFPITACCVMGWYVKDINEKHRVDISELNEQHRQEMNDVKEALNNNTLALQKLCDKLGG
jgi:hypothetical protein